MFPFLQNLFGGAGNVGAAAMTGAIGAPSATALANVQPGLWSNLDAARNAAQAAPAVNPNPEIMFDPTLGKVVPGSLTPGMSKPGGPPVPMPNPMRQPYGGPDMPPLARGTPGPAPAAEPAPPGAGLSAGSWTSAMKDQEQPYGGPDLPPMARGAPNTGNPLMDYIRYRTGGSF